mgnify:FL=1
MEKLIKATKVEVPEILIEDEARYMLSEIKEDIEKKGIEFAKFLEQAKTSEENLLKKYSQEGEKRVIMRFAIRYLLKAEDIKISDEEINAEFEKIKAMYPQEQHKKIEADFAGGDLSTQIANRMAIKKLFDRVLL